MQLWIFKYCKTLKLLIINTRRENYYNWIVGLINLIIKLIKLTIKIRDVRSLHSLKYYSLINWKY